MKKMTSPSTQPLALPWPTNSKCNICSIKRSNWYNEHAKNFIPEEFVLIGGNINNYCDVKGAVSVNRMSHQWNTRKLLVNSKAINIHGVHYIMSFLSSQIRSLFTRSLSHALAPDPSPSPWDTPSLIWVLFPWFQRGIN